MDPASLNAALYAASQGASAYSQFAAGRVNQRQARLNGWLADRQAQDARARGEEEVARGRRRAGAIRGAQRAAYAGQGVDVGAGSAADIQDETDFLAKLDEIVTRNNAAREAWGYRVQGRDARMRGDVARMEGDAEGFRTLLGAARGYGTFLAQRDSERG